MCCSEMCYHIFVEYITDYYSYTITKMCITTQLNIFWYIKNITKKNDITDNQLYNIEHLIHKKNRNRDRKFQSFLCFKYQLNTAFCC